MVIAGWPLAELEANRKDFEGNFLTTLELVPEFAARFRAATRETRFVGASLPNFFRKPFGPGWALIGDAGYTKDFITAQGIRDAFRARTVHRRPRRCVSPAPVPSRSRWPTTSPSGTGGSLPFYELTAQLAPLEPLPKELEQLLAATQGNQEAMDQFARVAGAVMSPADFFSEENVGRILGIVPPLEPAP